MADAATPEVVSKKRKMYKRLYDDKYFAAFGFTVINVAGEQRPQCVICSVVLSNDDMKPAKLSRHFTSKHAEYKGKSDEYFNRLCLDMKQHKPCLSATVDVSANALKASYLVAQRVAKCGQSHTIAESVILSAALDMVRTVLGEKKASTLRTIPLSNDTVQRRIADKSIDLMEQVVERINNRRTFTIQLDESTDISSEAKVLTYVRYIFNASSK